MPAKGIVVLVVVLAVGSSAASASPGVYTVFSCRGPDGAANAAAGWTSSTGGGAGVANDCLGGGGLVAQLAGPNPAPASAASWTFAAPANTSIVSLAAQRRTNGVVAGQNGDNKGAPAYHLYLDNAVLDSCEETNTSQCQGDLTAPVSRQGLSGSALSFAVQCDSPSIGQPCQNAISATFAQAAVGLRDASPPSVGGVRVLDDGARSGTLRVGFDASDLGGGVYTTVVKVDGEPVTRTPVAPGGTCAPAPGGDAYSFLVPVPCPLSAPDLRASVDAAKLAPGPHGVELDVEDAAGNATAVHGPIAFPAPNVGTTTAAASTAADVRAAMHARLRMWFVENRGRVLRHRYGTRVVTRGVLRDARGHGIVGARVSVYHLVGPHLKRRLLKTGLRSRARGELTLILPVNLDTRRLEFRYQALVPGPVTARRRLDLRVYRHGRLFVRSR